MEDFRTLVYCKMMMALMSSNIYPPLYELFRLHSCDTVYVYDVSFFFFLCSLLWSDA